MTALGKVVRDDDELERLIEVARCNRPASVDLLGQAVEKARALLSNRTIPVGDRLITFWAVAKVARDFAAWDVHDSELLRLARETGLAADLGRHAVDEDLRHVISWAWHGTNPFAGPLT
jgi:hypothetical protein